MRLLRNFDKIYVILMFFQIYDMLLVCRYGGFLNIRPIKIFKKVQARSSLNRNLQLKDMENL